MSQSFLLPGPNADFWDWQLHGACRGENSDVFYHPDGEHALASGEPYGVWGGMSESERVVALRSRDAHATVSA